MNYISLVLGSAILLFIVYFWSMRMREIADSRRWVPVFDPNKDTSLPKSPPRISVIVPARNEEALIGTCLRSILAQDYPNLEIICVDDRSTDRTAEIVGKLFEGRTNCHLNEYKEAIADFSDAIRINIKYAPAYFNRGVVKLILDQKDSGLLDLYKAKYYGDDQADAVIKKYC